LSWQCDPSSDVCRIYTFVLYDAKSELNPCALSKPSQIDEFAISEKNQTRLHLR
jgi:hypothetical protein